MNNKIKVLAKGSLSPEFLNIKTEIGARHNVSVSLEVQLLNEMLQVSPEGVLSFKHPEEVYDLDSCKNIPIEVIHAPLLGWEDLADLNIEDMANKDMCVILDYICYIAEYFAKKQNHTVDVIVHSEMDLRKMDRLGIMLPLVKNIDEVLAKYPDVRILIENVSPLRDRTGGIVHLCNNFKFDNIELVKYLQAELKTDRLGTVLDTCHADMTKMYMEAMYNVTRFPCEDYSMDAYFKNNKDYIGLIHLSKTVGDGYGEGHHGQPFNPNAPEDYKLAKERLSLYEKYGYTCPITLEVAETDYRICTGFENSLVLLDKVLEELEACS